MRFAIFLSLTISLLAINQTSCFIADYTKNLGVRKEKARNDLEELCNNLPPPVGFEKKKPTISLDIAKVVIAYNYKSSNPCEDTLNHYKTLLEKKGWDTSKMNQKISRGGISTIDTDFVNDDYFVTISCENTQNNQLKQQSIYCSWGLK